MVEGIVAFYVHALVAYLLALLGLAIGARLGLGAVTTAAVVYVALLLTSQLAAGRIASYGALTVPQGVALYTATLAMLDIIVVAGGLRAARSVIALGAATQGLLVAMPHVLVTAPAVFSDEAWRATMLVGARIAMASITAYVVTEAINALLTWRFRDAIWKRTFMSDPLALIVDTAVFIPLAFAGALPSQAIAAIALNQAAAKLMLTPLNYAVLRTTHKLLGTWTKEVAAPPLGALPR